MTSMEEVVAGLPAHLQDMAVEGYGSTAGFTRLDQISLSMILVFEEYLEEAEERKETFDSIRQYP